MDLNPGGIIGALGGGAIAAGVVFGVLDHEAMRNPGRLVAIALIAGAFAGNAIWGRVFPKPATATAAED